MATNTFDDFASNLPTDKDELELLLTKAFQVHARHNVGGTAPAPPEDKLTSLRDHHRKLWKTGPTFLFEHEPGTIKSATLRAHWLDLRRRSSFRREEVPALFEHFRARAEYLSRAQKIHVEHFSGKILPWTFVEFGHHVPKVVDEAFLVLFEGEIRELEGKEA